jgi:predicted ATPase
MAVAGQSRAQRKALTSFDVDDRAFALGILSNVLWLQGFPEQALETADSSVREAKNPISLCIALKCAASVSLKAGDLSGAERIIASLAGHAKTHCLDVDYACGLGLQGQLAARRDEAVEAVHKLRIAVNALWEARYQIMRSEFLKDLADAMARSGNISEGLAAIEEAVRRPGRTGEGWLIPETLRVKAELLLQQDRANSAEAEQLYLDSLEMARNQGALSWELRNAMSLGQLYRADGRICEAYDLLSSVYAWFTEGFETADLRRAERLLGEWSCSDSPMLRL